MHISLELFSQWVHVKQAAKHHLAGLLLCVCIYTHLWRRVLEVISHVLILLINGMRFHQCCGKE